MLMFSFDAVALFDFHPILWPLNTHLEDVTSQVICFMSIYKTIMCEREGERERESHWRDSCSSTGCDPSIFGWRHGKREREREIEGESGTRVMECDEFPQSLACRLA